MDDFDEFLIDDKIFDPYELTKEQLETIRRITRVIMDSQKCCYTKACIIAYIEWLSMVDHGQQSH